MFNSCISNHLLKVKVSEEITLQRTKSQLYDKQVYIDRYFEIYQKERKEMNLF